MKKKLIWAILFSIGFMVLLLSRVEWEHFSLIAGRLDIKYIVIGGIVFALGNLVRTLRFIQFDHTHKKLAHWWSINALYNFLTATLPGGAGEAAAAYVLTKYSTSNILAAFRLLLLGRLMDLSSLTALFFLASVLISSATPYREAAMWLTGVIFVMTSLMLVPASERFMMRQLQRLPGHISLLKKFSEKLNELLTIAKEKHRTSFYAITLTQSVAAIIAGIITLHLLLRSFGIVFTPVQSIYCYGVYAVFQVIPVQGFAGIGTQAAWFALALKTAGYQGADVLALGIVLHGTFYMFITMLGLSAVLVWLVCRERT